MEDSGHISTKLLRPLIYLTRYPSGKLTPRNIHMLVVQLSRLCILIATSDNTEDFET